MDDSQKQGTDLLICTKCLAGEETPEGGQRPGERLFAAMSQQSMPEGVTLRAVECLQNCDYGCSAALRGGPDRWAYIYGNFDPDRDAGLLTQGATLYQASNDGLIPWRQRPEHFKRNCIARLPPVSLCEEDQNG